MQLKFRWKFLYAIIILLGSIFPFIDYLTIFEMLYLLIPFGIVVIVSFFILIVSLVDTTMNSRISLLFFLIIPVFITTQLLSVFTVDKIQRLRSENIIKVIEEKIKVTGEIPDDFNSGFGIEYKKSVRDNNYIVSYSRGFMVTEKYDSKLKTWKNYGWND